VPQSILEMAKELIQAQIEAGQLSPVNIAEALQQTHASLLALKTQEETRSSTVETPSAPTNWRKSITRHVVTCLECGASFKQLSGRHLRIHDLDGRTYREKYGIPRTQALAARATTARRREIVQQSRPWEKTPTFVKAQEGKVQAKKVGRKRAVELNRFAAVESCPRCHVHAVSLSQT
jgi:predicted transcriptional regulator